MPKEAAYDPAFDLAAKFQEAFTYFNKKLFGNRLPAIVVTVQRHRGAAGFFCPESYQQRAFDEQGEQQPPEFTVHEIAIMPDAMCNRTDREVLSTLVHEMCHLQQQEQGKPSRNGYHNREWGKFMRQVGLEPTSQGKFDVRNPELSDEEREHASEGTPTGQSMSHFIIPQDRFDTTCADLLKSGFSLNLQQAPHLHIAAPKSKLKYTCPKCGQKAWAKRGSNLACGDCQVVMDCEESEDEN